MQRGGGYGSRPSRNQGYEDRRGNTGGYEDRRGQARGGFEVRREGGGGSSEDRRGSSRHDPSQHHPQPTHKSSRDTRTSQPQAGGSHYNGSGRHREEHAGHSSGSQRHNDRSDRRHSGANHGDRLPDPWSSWQTSKTEPSGRERGDRRESNVGPVRDREGGRVPARDRKEDERRPRDADRERERRHKEERERERERKERQRRDEERKLEEKRRLEERRLEEIRKRELEIQKEEERLRRMEENQKVETERRRERERREREREERERRRRREERHRSRSPVRQPASSSGRRGRSAERSSHRRRSSSSSRRSALDRLGPKVPVVSRLGAGKVSRKRRRPGSKERSTENPEEDKDNMQITIAGDKNEEGSSRKVARDVDIESFTVLDQVGEEDGEKKDDAKETETNGPSKTDEIVDLEKIVIKKREKKDDRKSTDGKDLVIKKPSSLISILAKRKQLMSVSQNETVEMTDQERSEIRKRCKAKYSSEDKVTEKVISMALDLVQFDESKTCDLIDQVLKEDIDESQEIQDVTEEEASLNNEGVSEKRKDDHPSVSAPAVTVAEDVHDQLDFEAEEAEEPEKAE